MQHPIAIGLRDGFDPIGAMGSEIARTQRTTGGALHACREFAGVEGRAARGRDVA